MSHQFPLTPEELERAARALAVKRGLDPDWILTDGANERTYWQKLAQEITHLVDIIEVLTPIMEGWDNEEGDADLKQNVADTAMGSKDA